MLDVRYRAGLLGGSDQQDHAQMYLPKHHQKDLVDFHDHFHGHGNHGQGYDLSGRLSVNYYHE